MAEEQTYDRDTAWSDVAERLRWLTVLFGHPVEILHGVRLAPRDARILRGWLAGLEALVRALLLMLAAEIDPPPRPPAAPQRAKHPAQPPPAAADALAEPDSARWRGVAFRTFPRPNHASPAARRRHSQSLRGRAGAGGGPRPVDAAPLAKRFEALFRVADAPERHARRLALRLSRRPGRDHPRLLRPPPGCRHPTSVPPGLWDDVLAAQDAARAVHPLHARGPTAVVRLKGRKGAA